MGAGRQRWWAAPGARYRAECEHWNESEKRVIASAIARASRKDMKPLRRIVEAFADLWRNISS